jgi:phytoene dehydrogenase-like protein
MTLPGEVDIAVLGAGPDGLVCAAYLAEAGLRVAVLEARPLVDGNTVTGQPALPGYAHDSHSSAHVLIQSNPLLADDELGLLTKWGLDYAYTDPPIVLPQPDGDPLIVHRDLDATVDEIGRRSAPDAAAYRGLIDEWTGGLAAVHGRWSSGLPLGDSPAAGAYRALRARSAWDVVHDRFRHPVVRSLMLWLSLATMHDPRRSGTGVLPSSIAAGRLRFGWSTPIGGSGSLPAALVRLVEARDGTVDCDAPVSHIDVRDGRAVAVRTADGRRVRVRRGVVAGSHLAQRTGLPVDAPDAPTEARDARRPALSVFAVHASVRGDLSFTAAGRSVPSVAAGLGGTDGIVAQLAACERGETDATDPWLLVVNETVADPSRAPDGGGTLKILTVVPCDRADGRPWSQAKDEFAAQLVERVRAHAGVLGPDNVLAVRAESPMDVAAHNEHHLGGSCHGGEFLMPDDEVLVGRPRYDTSIDSLFLTGSTSRPGFLTGSTSRPGFLTGSTSRPGGSASGRPGRDAARAVLTALRMDPATVMGPA